jgi:hypothetical protein
MSRYVVVARWYSNGAWNVEIRLPDGSTHRGVNHTPDGALRSALFFAGLRDDTDQGFRGERQNHG